MAGIVGLTCLKGKTPEKCLDIILDRYEETRLGHLFILDRYETGETGAFFYNSLQRKKAENWKQIFP